MKFGAFIAATSAFGTNEQIFLMRAQEETMAYMYSQAYSTEFATAINSVRGYEF